MRLRDFLKSPARRRAEEREEAERFNAAYDQGREFSRAVTSIIDAFLSERALPLAQHLNDVLVEQMEATHGQAGGEAIAVWHAFRGVLTDYKARMVGEIHDHLTDWHDVIAKIDINHDFDRYIDSRLTDIVKVLSDKADNQLVEAGVHIFSRTTANDGPSASR